jgi:hypothetical protein
VMDAAFFSVVFGFLLKEIVCDCNEMLGPLSSLMYDVDQSCH